MRNASLLLVSALLASAACRPSGDRVDATESGAVAPSGAPASRSTHDPVAKGAEKATPETLPTNLAVAPGESEAMENDTGNLAANAVDTNKSASPAPTIPGQYRDSWGMVPADCEPGRSDAKGLIRIGDRTIRFYESTATLKEQRPSVATSFSGEFSFTGEGMSWTKVMTLALQGNRLTRTEDDQRYTYTRCP
jgi:hypothetical protein